MAVSEVKSVPRDAITPTNDDPSNVSTLQSTLAFTAMRKGTNDKVEYLGYRERLRFQDFR